MSEFRAGRWCDLLAYMAIVCGRYAVVNLFRLQLSNHNISCGLRSFLSAITLRDSRMDYGVFGMSARVTACYTLHNLLNILLASIA